jgi:dTDP-4-amino-4,6-dideoxygalactose transaminase
MGANYRMAELQAGLANVAIERFPAQMEEREAMASYLDEALSEIPGVRVLRRDIRHTTRSFYRYIFAIDPKIFGFDHNLLTHALQKEGIPVDTGYPAMHRYPLFQPQLSRLPVPTVFADRLKFNKMRFPEAERAAEREAVWINENVFRAGRQGIDDVTDALKKIYSNRAQVAEVAKQDKR